MVRYVLSMSAILIALTGSSAVACISFRALDLKDALQAEAVFLGTLISAESEAVETPGGFSYYTHRLDFSIERPLSGNLHIDQHVSAVYYSKKSRKFGQIGVRYVVVLGGLQYQINEDRLENKHFIQTAVCGGNAPYVFEEGGEAGRALKMIFNNDGVAAETKADILSRFVGLYGQKNF